MIAGRSTPASKAAANRLGAANIRDEYGVMQKVKVQRLPGSAPKYRLTGPNGETKQFDPRTDELPHNQPRPRIPYR